MLEMPKCWILVSRIVAICLITGPMGRLAAQAQPAGVHELGAVDFPVDCDESVRDGFNLGIALLHHMTYPAARVSFDAVIDEDPDCALAYWGAAMTYFQPLWPNRPGPSDLERGWALVQEARRLVRPDGRASMFVATGEGFFDPQGNPDYWDRIARWAAATERLHRAYPEDREAAALFALAHLATASQSGEPARQHAEAAEVLERILAAEPTHPGAVHYLIHANDFARREGEALDVVRSYDEIAPRNAHALHMPTHIFVRLGSWDEVIDGNRRAAAAALDERVGPGGRYVWDEFPHAVEYLVYAYLQQGDDAQALDQIRTLQATADLQPSFKTAFHLSATAARYALERHDWPAAAAVPVRTPTTLDWDAFPWPEAIAWFARGLGSAHTRDAAEVRRSLDRLGALQRAASASGETLFADQIHILRLEVEGWQALGEGDAPRAVRLLEEAAELERRSPKHPVTPGAIVPAEELLGDLHHELRDFRAARAAYEASDARVPGRFNTILGLARTSDALGDAASARSHYQRLLAIAAPSSMRAGVEEARAYLARR